MIMEVSRREPAQWAVKLFTDWHDLTAAQAGMRERLPAQTIDRVTEAIEFAQARHGDQRRPTGVPYLEHLLEALEMLVAGAGVTDPDVLAAAVLHDVVEDTGVSNDELAERFGPRVAELVGWVTIPEPGPGEDRQAVKQASCAGSPALRGTPSWSSSPTGSATSRRCGT